MGFSFADHIGLLEHFLAGRREDSVDQIARRLLNLKGKAKSVNITAADRGGHSQRLFLRTANTFASASRLNGQLAAARLADGFEPVAADGYARELDPADLVLRAHHYWDHSRWPGRNGRIIYAQSLYAVFMMRQLEHLSLRIWDDGSPTAAERLQQVQPLLDLLNAGAAPPRVRDARWLIQPPQSPLTKHLKTVLHAC